MMDDNKQSKNSNIDENRPKSDYLKVYTFQTSKSRDGDHPSLSSFDDSTDEETDPTGNDDVYDKICQQYKKTPCGAYRRQQHGSILELDNCLLGGADIRPICIALMGKKFLRSVDLSGNDIGNEGAAYIADMIKGNKHVSHLYLASCNLGNVGITSICRSLQKNKTIKLFDLSDNKFSTINAKDIAEMLKMNETLGELMLTYCNIDEEAAVLLGSALAENISLKSLDLSWNGIRKRGAVKLCQGLAVNECLEYLDLSWNGLDREGCVALESCLKRNTVLKELDLTCNRIDYIGLKPVVNGLVKNYTLRVLKLSLNPLTTTGAVAVLRAIILSPRCSIKEIYLTDIPVDKDFMKCLAQLYDVRSIKVIHGENLHQTHQGTEKPKAALEHYDPCMVLFEYMRQENLRLIDLFRVLDTDQSGTLSRKELCQAFLAMNLPLSVASLELLMQRLDSDDNNEIDIEEMKKGQKKTFRKAHAMRRNSEFAYDAILEDIKKHVKTAIDEKRRTKPNESHDIISRIEKAMKT